MPQPAAADLHPEISIGSTGLGVSVHKDLKHHRALRLEYDAIDFGGYKLNSNYNSTIAPSPNITPVSAQIEFNDTFHTQSISLLLDQHIRTTPLYFTAGIAADFNKLDAISIPGQSAFQIGSTNYPGSTFGNVYVHVRWNTIVPYLGFGFQAQPTAADPNKRAARLELGAYAQGARRISVDTTGIIAEYPIIFEPYVQAFQNTVPAYVPRLSIYPVLRFSVPVGR
jgi:hypothetical protein